MVAYNQKIGSLREMLSVKNVLRDFIKETFLFRQEKVISIDSLTFSFHYVKKRGSSCKIKDSKRENWNPFISTKKCIIFEFFKTFS